MTDQNVPMHYVCTLDEAARLIRDAPGWWVEPCGCREGGEGCQRSTHEICLLFDEGATGSTGAPRKITREEALGLVELSRERWLVARPFRDSQTRSRTDGICFCCDDCCGYFLNADEVCDKGVEIEATDWDDCTHCGLCEPVCYFKARTMKDGSLELDRERCYGCGLCVASCPEDCITMEPRR